MIYKIPSKHVDEDEMGKSREGEEVSSVGNHEIKHHG